MSINMPKEILKPNHYPIYEGEQMTYTTFKYHGKVYEGCYEYIHWWKCYDGKWKCFKIYLEKGNKIYNQYLNFLKNGNDESGWSCKFVEW